MAAMNQEDQKFVEQLEVRIVPKSTHTSSPLLALERANNERAKAATAIRRLSGEVERAREEVDQCHAKSTCCCGDYVRSHNESHGHSPVSQYDYVLENRTSQLSEALELLEQAYDEFCAVSNDDDFPKYWAAKVRAFLSRTKPQTQEKV